MPPPATSGDDLRDLIFAPAPAEPRRAAPPPPPPPPGVDDLLQALARRPALEPATPATAAPDMPEADRKALIDAVLREIISDPDASYRSIAEIGRASCRERVCQYV